MGHFPYPGLRWFGPFFAKTASETVILGHFCPYFDPFLGGFPIQAPMVCPSEKNGSFRGFPGGCHQKSALKYCVIQWEKTRNFSPQKHRICDFFSCLAYPGADGFFVKNRVFAKNRTFQGFFKKFKKIKRTNRFNGC